MPRSNDAVWDVLDDAARRLEECWRSGSEVDLADFLPAESDPHRLRVLTLLIKLDQEHHWESGDRRPLEDYLRRWSELANRPELLTELLAAECLTRAGLGCVPTREELQGRFPTVCHQIDLAAIEAEAASHQPAEHGPPDLGRIGKYQLLELVGEGGMGRVYKARHERLQRIVALKVLRKECTADALLLKRFTREMTLIGGLDHSNIVRAVDADTEDGVHYLVMDFVEGLDLGKVVRVLGTMPIADACDATCQLAQALQHIHEYGLVHRDIKPHNLMLTREGQVKLLDLGLSRLSDESSSELALTEYGTLMGTADYIAPEQCRDSHNVDIRADLYSLGCLLYELLCGHAPFATPEFATRGRKIEAHLTIPPPAVSPLRPETPKQLATVLDRLLAKEPAERYATPGEVCAALKPYAVGSDLRALVDRVVATSHAEVDTANSLRDTKSLTRSAAVDTHDDKKRSLVTPKTAADRRRWALLASAAVGLAAVLLLAGVIVITTRAGTVVVETEDPNVEVSVKHDGEEVDVLDAKSNWRVRLKAGRYELNVKGQDDRFEVTPNSVTVRRGEIARVVITHRPLEHAASRVPTTERRKASPVLSTARLKDALTERKSTVSVPAPGEPLSHLALVSEPSRIPGGGPWTIETCGHRGRIHDIKYSPDSHYLASAGDDGSIRIWLSENGDLVRVLVGQADSIRYLAWSPDGSRLASAGDHSIRIWDVDQGRATHNLPAEFCAVAWSPDGGRLAGGNHVWDVKSGDVVLQLDAELGGNGLFQVMDWSPDGKLLATGAGAGTICLADAVSGKQVRVLPEQNGAVRSLGWCPDNNLLASVSADGKSVSLWESKTGKLARKLECPFYGTSIAWSADGKKIALSSYYGIGIHDPSSGSDMDWKRDTGGGTGTVAWSPDGKWIARTCSASLEQRGALGGELYWEFPTHAFDRSSVAWSPDGQRLAINADQIAVYDWPLMLAHRIDLGSGVCSRGAHAFGWSPDGRVLALGGINGAALYDAATGKSLAELTCDGLGEVVGVRWSPHGDRLAGSNYDDTTCVWQSEDRRLQFKLKGGLPSTWSPDGSVLCAGGRIYDATTGEQTAEIGSQDRYRRIAWSPRGDMIAASIPEVTLFDATTRQRLQTLPCPHPDVMTWSPDGKTLTMIDTVSGELLETDIATGRLTRRRLPNAPPGFYDMTTDCRMLARVTSAAAVEFWDTARLRRTGVLLPLSNSRSLTIAPSGHHRGTVPIESNFVYVVHTEKGQETLTPEQFTVRFGWKNDPDQVNLELEKGTRD